MSRRLQEIIDVQPRGKQGDQVIRGNNTERTARVLLSQDLVTERASIDNTFILGTTPHPNQAHARFHLGAPGGAVAGLGNSRVSGADFDEQSIVSGLMFTEQVNIGSTQSGAVMFFGCVFDDTIRMTAGTQAHFVCCLFRNTSSVSNPGAAGNVSITGCHRSSGVAHINVTIISETT